MAGFRAARLLPGVGPATATKLLDALDAAPEVMPAMEAFKAPPSAEADWNTFLTVFRALRAARASWPAELEIVTRWYEPHLERLYDDAPVRQRDLVQLHQIASTYRSRERFLTEMALDPPDATSGEAGASVKDDDYLILSTIHSAKGQEWKAVHILNVIDGCIPSDMSTGTPEEVEEERRLLYVAMTRAKDDLQLLLPQRFYTHQQSAYGDRHVYAARSRFIPDALTALFEYVVWPVAAQETDATVAPSNPAPPIDIAARIRQSWG
jgi:DNA helicase-2/ATP-dependent DNA helicase PcrA